MALDALSSEDAVAKGSQQFLLCVLLDYDVLVGPCLAVCDRFVPRGLGYESMMSEVSGAKVDASSVGSFLH